MALTYEPIATQTVTSVGTVSFTSIPSTYTDFRVVYSGYNDAPIVKLNFNGDTANLNVTFMGGNGNVVGGSAYGDGWLFVWAAGVGTQFNFTVDVMNYANTSIQKSWVAKTYITDNAGGATSFNGNWASTAAINRIDFITSSATMSGTFTLYGIKAA